MYMYTPQDFFPPEIKPEPEPEPEHDLDDQQKVLLRTIPLKGDNQKSKIKIFLTSSYHASANYILFVYK